MNSIIPVATSEGVTVHCPSSGRYSFFNSPYPPHKLFKGIDVYLDRSFGEIAPSPVEGKVVQIRKIRCPKGRGFQDPGFDIVTLIQSLEDSDRMIKILHVAPVIQRGEVVEPGQELGRLLRSGYFNFWTDPHIHVEVRKPSDPLRARGGFTLLRLLEVDASDQAEELRGTVLKSIPEYSLISLNGGFRHGLPADVGGVTGLLDGGIPHYGWVGAHIGVDPPRLSMVKLCGKPIAEIKKISGNTCLADCMDITIKVDGIPVGLSCYLFPASEPVVKLVPPRVGELHLEASSEVSLAIN
jgi:hypothetical protein